MSLSYTDLVSHSVVTTTPASDAKVLGAPGNKNKDYLVTKLRVEVITQATTGETFILETAEASPTVLATIDVDTDAAYTTYETLVSEANRQITAGTGWWVRASEGGDASVVASVQVIATDI